MPVNFYEGDFYVKWDTLGEDIPPYYTPISKTKVIVTGEKGVPIYTQSILPIPYGGTSLWTKISVDNAPDIGFSLKLSFVT